MKFMLSKELGCSSQEEPQGAGSFWKFGSRGHSNIKKKEAYFLLCFIFITDSMGNTFRPIWTVSLALFPPSSYIFSCDLKICHTSRNFSIDGNLGLGWTFHFELSIVLFLGKQTALNFQLSQVYKQGCKQGNEQIPRHFSTKRILHRSTSTCLEKVVHYF